MCIRDSSIDDPTTAKILPLWQDTISTEAALKSSGLGPNHPKIKELEATQEVYKEQLDQAISSVKVAMATRLELARTTQAVLEQRLKDANDEFIQRNNAGSDYTDAKYRYLEAKRLLEASEQRYTCLLYTSRSIGNAFHRQEHHRRLRGQYRGDHRRRGADDGHHPGQSRWQRRRHADQLDLRGGRCRLHPGRAYWDIEHHGGRDRRNQHRGRCV